MKRLLALSLLMPLAATAQFPCYPSQVGGSGSRAFFEEDAAAKAFGWWCSNPTQLVLISGPNSAFPTDWKQIGLDLLTKGSAERLAAFQQYYKADYPVVDGKLIVPADVYPVHKKVWDQLQPLKPVTPPPVTEEWVVAPSGIYTTRATYPVVNGVRVTTPNGKTTVGSSCNCGLKVVERTLTFCAVNGTTTQFSVCQKKGG